jgi:hypothetical protein
MDKFIIYHTADGKTDIKLYEQDGTIGMTQAQIAELFQTTPQNITLHIKNIYETKELDEISTCKDYLQVEKEGNRTVKRSKRIYSLDMILAIGFRVRSIRGTQFRIWANTHLKEYLQKGFLVDTSRLKNPDGRPDYFDELLAKIRDIRASEKRFYQKLRDLFALSSDYIPSDKETMDFFAETQNKLIFAVTGMTAPEIVVKRANAAAPNMALTAWKGSVVRRQDIYIAKNYLTENEIDSLNRLVTIFLESAEFRVKNHEDLKLAYWKQNVDKLIIDHNVPLLKGKGQISRQQMLEQVDDIYNDFDDRRKKYEAMETDRAEMLELEQLEHKLKRK